MKYFQLIALLLLLLPFSEGFAQFNKPLRIEIGVKSSEEPFRLVTCGENGLVLFAQTTKVENKDNVLWTFNFVDKNLKNQGQVLYPVPRSYDFYDYEVSENKLFMLFNSSKTSLSDECMLLFIDPSKYVVASIPFKVPSRSTISSIKITGNTAYIALVSKTNKFYVVKVNMGEGKSSTIIEEKVESPNVMSMLLEPGRNLLSLFVQKEERKNKFENSIYSYDLSGAKVGETNYTGFSKDCFLVNAELFRNKANQLLVLGSFNNEPSRRFSEYFSNGTETSGFFSGLLVSNDAHITYHRFSELTNFHGYFENQSSIFNRSSKKSKRISDINYTAVAHNIQKIDSAYYFILETYVPEYHRNYRQSYNLYYSLPGYSDYPVLDGYRFINAITVSFNEKADVKWSSAMEIRDVFSKYIYPRMDLVVDGENTILSYSTKGKILSKVVDGPDSKTGFDQMSIMPDKAKDEIIDDYNNGLAYWYDNNFIAYGYQLIRNNFISINKRTVFYINKLAFR
jgi:hypothetical protein